MKTKLLSMFFGVVATIILFYLIGLMGKPTNVSASSKGGLYFLTGGIHNADGVYVFIDPDTDVEYLIYNREASNTVMIPRYNADGSLMVSPMHETNIK